MAKRRATVDSDDEDQLENSQASKRARTEEDSDDEPQVVESSPAPKREKKRAAKGKANAKRKGDDDDDDSDEEEFDVEGDEEEDKKFEEENEGKIRAAIELKRKLEVHGGIAEHGIIERVEMIDFMCHKFLTFNFGPQINFIIGHNGSGKSAVLSAITVALGGKAISTGRGSGLKSFIREGQGVSEVTITIKNQGEEAYKPKDYGKSIVITRRFTKEGGSSWKIKSKDGKVISTKKDELAAICDHMNIQVDNPMNVLTQDAARQFLSASHPSDKYKFFLRGTQLSQLSDEYDTCLENITQTSKVLAQKREALPDLRTAFKEAKVRFEEASKARDQRHKADELKKELAWAHVAAKEEELTKKIQEVTKIKTSRLPKLQNEVNNATEQFRLATEEVAKYEAEHQELGNIEDLTEKKKDLQARMNVNKAKLAEIKQNEREMDTSLKSTNNQIKGYDERIAEETRRLEVNTQAKREETNRKLQAAKDKVAEAEAHLKVLENRMREKTEERDAMGQEGVDAEHAMKTAQERVDHCNSMIQKAKEQEQNNLAPYGKDMKRVLGQIDRMKWQGQKPVGPLGVYVKVREPRKWAPLLRSQLGGFMTAFACTDARDRTQLKRLLHDSGNPQHLIIISERDMFDYSAGEPHHDVLTVLRALEISDPYVLRVLINQAHIERTLLAPKRVDADNILKSVRGGGMAWTADFMRVQKFPEGGGSSTKLNQVPANGDLRNLLFTGTDAATQLKDWQDELRNAEHALHAATDKHHHLRQAFSACKHAVGTLDTQGKAAYNNVRQEKTAYASLQEEANEDLPVGLASLEDAKADAEKEKQSIMEQFADVTRRRMEVDDAQKPLLVELNAVKQQINDFNQTRTGVVNKVEEAATARMTAQNNLDHYNKKLAEENAKLAKAEDLAAEVQNEFESWREKASLFCEQFDNPRKVDLVQRNLTSVQNALNEREKRHGATVEQMTIEVNKAKANLDTAEKDLNNMSILNKALKSSLIIRLAKWQEFRRHIALRCKLVFQYHLSNRGYYGKVLFDHAAETLQLKVQTDEQTQTQGARDKDPRSLSGGEKSFSTICLLLSLWESIGCPLRCLDEFDVFLDAVNRRISMKMMIDTANASDKKQYILITPLSVNVEIGKTVRIHRMSDPERNQGTLFAK